jgi:hypothetical protein
MIPFILAAIGITTSIALSLLQVRTFFFFCYPFSLTFFDDVSFAGCDIVA